MNYIFILLTILIIGLVPIFKKIFDQLQLSVNHKQFDLLRKLVEEAVYYVNQVDLVEEMPPSKKKELAISVAQGFADNFGIPKSKQSSINNLIESILWGEEDTIADDDDFDD
jgi:hypothetical protein